MLLVVAFPPVIVVVAIALVVLSIWVPLRARLGSPGALPVAAGLAIRGAWLGVALLGLAALVGDVRALV